MASKLGERIKQTKAFESVAQEALLAVIVAAAEVREHIDRVSKEYGLGSSHYNVLRILRGAPEKGYPRCDIIERMLDPAPDVTRLIDALSNEGLVERRRCQEDRRKTMHTITDAGRELLDEMHDAMVEVGRQFGSRFSEAELNELAYLCEKIYAPARSETPLDAETG